MNSTRRKKAPRRRIVDLANDESFGRVPDEDIAATISRDPSTIKHKTLPAGCDPPKPASIPMETPEDDLYDGSTQTPSLGSSEQLHQQDDYRVKIEALRQEFGSNWLSALGDQDWHHSHHMEVTQNQNLGHNTLHRSGHQVIVSGGRTLG